MQKNTIQFWTRSIILLIIIIVCLGYLLFTFFFNFLTGNSKQDVGYSYYLMIGIHVTIIVICFLYLYEKIKSWKIQYLINRDL